MPCSVLGALQCSLSQSSERATVTISALQIKKNPGDQKSLQLAWSRVAGKWLSGYILFQFAKV